MFQVPFSSNLVYPEFIIGPQTAAGSPPGLCYGNALGPVLGQKHLRWDFKVSST